jgi:hypothetical protein
MEIAPQNHNLPENLRRKFGLAAIRQLFEGRIRRVDFTPDELPTLIKLNK